MIVIEIPINEVKPYKNNPRKNEKAIEQVRQSIEAYGFKQPIVVDKNDIIVVGHTRFYAAMDMDLQTVPVVVADDLNEKECKAYRVADNKTSEFSEWDIDLLRVELSDIDELFTGFEIGELDKLFDIESDSKDFSDDIAEKFSVRVDCINEDQQQTLYEEFKERGLICQVLSL